MRLPILVACVFTVFGCGMESAGSAATIAKLQVEKAKQAKENLAQIKTDIEAAVNAAEQNRKKAEEAANN